MSRVATAKSASVAKRDLRPGGGNLQDGELHTQLNKITLSPDAASSSSEICPVCKTPRYMKPDMRLLINPVCYHKMCESCVDRIFSHGPAQCPTPKCSQTLRKNRFRQQTFEDIQVEREVDIRRRVAAVFNRREDEFESVRDYNDYLNDVEDITFNMINHIDAEETERRFKEYEKAHQAEIQENASLAQQESMSYSALQKSEREHAKLRREAARREEAEEKREVEANRRDILRRLENGQDPEKTVKEGQGVALKKRMNRQAAEQRQQQLQAVSDNRNGSSNIVIKGLKAKVKPEPEAPIDPFGGLSFETRYYTLQDEYVWDVLQTARNDALIGAGGYDVASFTSRAMCEAFSGLGVLIADEATERERLRQGDGVSTVGAKVAAREVKMDDPF